MIGLTATIGSRHDVRTAVGAAVRPRSPGLRPPAAGRCRPPTIVTSVERRHLLRAAVAAPAAGLAAPLLTGSPAAAAAGRTDPGSARFTLAVLPDTQYLFDADRSDPAPLRATFRYLLRERADENIVFLTHLGDITESGTAAELALAGETFAAIDGKVPYSVLAGNHDIRGGDDQRGASPYLDVFGPDRFRGMPTFAGSSPDGYNSAHLLPAGGRQWLILALDWRASDAGLTWAQSVIDAHPRVPVIVTTHDLVYADEAGNASLSGNGRRLWDNLIRDNDQVFLTLNGHYWPSGRTVLTNAAGHAVHAHITNYQERYYGGAGMIRLYHFDLARGVIDVSTSSPWFARRPAEDRNQLEAENLELTGDVDRFTIEIDFAARFAGFAPVPAPPARPASAVVTRPTVAYWRFDAEGIASAGAAGTPLATGTRVRDLTGRGNDLVASVLHGGPAEVLLRSDEHHPLQPAHASLRFDGGQSPDRAAVLEAVPGAPVNSERFLRGYTIEAFVKLPDPFEGAHAFMGLLSWQGRAGDAGKTQGYSPDEPTFSLNISGERFLQNVVYPAVQDASPTSWSHALPVGRWMHLAVVNDGREGTVYVDGSPIARNADGPSTGIATLGKPFVIGATQWAEAFGQGFYGWVGDVRISDRALRPREFLSPVR